MTATILPRITPQQQMALAFRDYGKPEGTVRKDGSVHVWVVRPDGAWLEALGRDEQQALHILAIEAAQAVRR